MFVPKTLPLSALRRRSVWGGNDVHMCDTTYSFGQRGNHFFQCPSRTDYTRLPPKLADLLKSNLVKRVHHVTLGYENSFLMTWSDHNGHDHIDSQGLPADLTEFIYARDQGQLSRSVSKIRLTLGPYNASFFVTDGSAYLWMNLPPALLAALQQRIRKANWLDRPRIVALGADSSFLLITEKHTAVWDLDQYIVLTNMLEFSRTQKRGIEEIKNVELHPYRYQCFVAESWNGTLLHGNLPPHELAGVEAVRKAVLEEAQVRLRRSSDKEKRKAVERPKRPELREQTGLKKEWSERKQEFTAKKNGLKLSLSLSISAKGLGLGLR